MTALNKSLIFLLIILLVPSNAAGDPISLSIEAPEFIDGQIIGSGAFYRFSIIIEAQEEANLSDSVLVIVASRSDAEVSGDTSFAIIYFGNKTIIPLNEIDHLSTKYGLLKNISEIPGFPELLMTGEIKKINSRIRFNERATYNFRVNIENNDVFLSDWIITPIHVIDPVEYATLSSNIKLVESSKTSAEAAKISASEAKRIADTMGSNYIWIVIGAVIAGIIGLFSSYLPEKWRRIDARNDDYSILNKEVREIVERLNHFSVDLLTASWNEIRGDLVRFHALHKDMQNDLSTFYEDAKKYSERLSKANNALKKVCAHENDEIVRKNKDIATKSESKLESALKYMVYTLYDNRVYLRFLLKRGNDFEKSYEFKQRISGINDTFGLEKDRIDPNEYLANIRPRIEKTSEFKDLEAIQSYLISSGNSLMNKLDEKVKRHWVRDIIS